MVYIVKLAADEPIRDQQLTVVPIGTSIVRQSGAWAVVGTAKSDVETVAESLP
ncbi:hypothetical protein [Paramicrobacterium agarici]|nr:hypothetical protein [Microbacterium agarici]